MKRICSLFAALCLAATLCGGVFATENSGALTFGEGGTFKILILSDTQDIDKPQSDMMALENAALDADAWDFVVFLGDQVHGSSMRGDEAATCAAIDAVVQPVAQRGIPFAVVFGNHDDEGGVSKQVQMAHYQTYANCLAVPGVCETGCGTYELPVQNAAGDTVCSLWFFDSGTYDTTGQSYYAWVAQDQLNWFADTSAQLTAQNGGKPVPGFVFQHIVVPEIYDLLEPAEKGTPGAVQGSNSHRGTYYVTGDAFTSGAVREGPCPPDVNSGEFAAWQQAGGIAAAFFGHDHVNDYIAHDAGIDLVACPGMTFYVYGSPETHNVRTVTLHESNPAAYDTEILTYEQLLGKPQPGGLLGTRGAHIYFYVACAAAIVVVLVGIVVAAVLLINKRKKAKLAAQSKV